VVEAVEVPAVVEEQAHGAVAVVAHAGEPVLDLLGLIFSSSWPQSPDQTKEL
jgi:hypothetical protein